MYKKKTYPIVQKLFAMRKYGGGMLYVALPLHTQEAVFGFKPMTNKSCINIVKFNHRYDFLNN